MYCAQIRPGRAEDVAGVAALAAELAQSFPFSAEKFLVSYPALLAAEDASLLVAVNAGKPVGYVLGFTHLTFFANGPVAWVEEIVVTERVRAQGVGKALMNGFEDWAAGRGCAMVALATRRAAPFYRALGYEESATYFRKVTPG